MMTGAASLSAASAAVRSPVAIASSTLRTKLRIFERRALLISVRRAILRVALRAELVLAMPVLVLRAIARPVHAISQKASAAARASPPTRAAYSGPARERQRRPFVTLLGRLRSSGLRSSRAQASRGAARP